MKLKQRGKGKVKSPEHSTGMMCVSTVNPVFKGKGRERDLGLFHHVYTLQFPGSTPEKTKASWLSDNQSAQQSMM